MPAKHIDPATLPPEVQAMIARNRTPEARRAIAELEAQVADRPGIAELVRRKVITGKFTTGATHQELSHLLAEFRAERQRQGLTLVELAERLGTDQANLTRFETGRQRNPTLDTLQRYALALGLRLGLVLSPGEPAGPGPLPVVQIEAEAAKGQPAKAGRKAKARRRPKSLTR